MGLDVSLYEVLDPKRLGEFEEVEFFIFSLPPDENDLYRKFKRFVIKIKDPFVDWKALVVRELRSWRWSAFKLTEEQWDSTKHIYLTSEEAAKHPHPPEGWDEVVEAMREAEREGRRVFLACG